MPKEHRILITGATGFVGSWLLRELKHRERTSGLQLVVLAAGRGEVSDLRAEITDRQQVETLLRECRPTAIIHLAAIAAPGNARKLPQRAWNVNFQGTLNLAYAAMEFAPDARFIFAGSAEAYGASFLDTAGEPIKENAALKPMSVYGATKAAADMLLGQLAYEGLNVIRFRPFNHTGPGQTIDYVVPAFASQLAGIVAAKEPARMCVGNLSAFRDFLDVRDVVRAYADAALNDAAHNAIGRVFNLSSGRSVQIQSILDMLIELAGVHVEFDVDPKRLRGSEIPAAAGDSSAACETFGWKPRISLPKTLSDVMTDWKTRTERNL